MKIKFKEQKAKRHVVIKDKVKVQVHWIKSYPWRRAVFVSHLARSSLTQESFPLDVTVAALGQKTWLDNLISDILQTRHPPVKQQSDLTKEIWATQGPHILFNSSRVELCDGNVPERSLSKLILSDLQTA